MNILKNIYFLLLGLVIVTLVSLPLLHPGFFHVHDYTHVARTIELVRTLQVGEFPVAWSQNFGFGYGMPLFLFYGPLPFYFTGSLVMLGLPALSAVKVLFILTNIIGFFGMYKLMSRWGKTVGFLSATAFLLAPYRAVDLYVRGDVSEAMGMSLLPLILHFSLLIRTKPKQGWVGLVITVFALILTHNLTAFIATPFLLLFAFVANTLGAKSLPWKNWLVLISGYFMAGLLSAFYAIPLMLEKQYTVVDQITQGYFDYHLHFLYIRQFLTAHWAYGGSVYGPFDDISFHLGRAILVLAAISVFFAIFRIGRSWLKKKSFAHQEKNWLVLLAALLLGLSLFLTLFKSEFIWNAIPLLSYVQFPWRFLEISSVFLAMLAGWSASYISKIIWRWAFVLATAIIIIATQIQYHHPEGYLGNADDLYYTDPTRIQANMSSILSDYIPKTFDQKLPPVSNDQRILVETNNQTAQNWELNRPQELMYVVEAPSGGTVTWNIADFPGWKYFINNDQVDATLLPDGRRQVITDQPIHSVSALFTSTVDREVGNLFSTAALVIFLAVAIPWKKDRRE